MPVLTPKIQRLIKEEREALLREQITPWIMGFANGSLNIKNFYGKNISYSGIEFEGSPRHIFWNKYIEPFLEDITVRLITDITQECLTCNLRLEEELSVLSQNLRNLYSVIFDEMAKSDQRICGKGHPDQVPIKNVSIYNAFMNEFMEQHINMEIAKHNSRQISPTRSNHDSKEIFIVHGHDDGPKQEVARFIEQLGLIPIILHERPNKGRTLITKLSEEADTIKFAIVLMTPDDHGKSVADADIELKPRARQNVVFELGFFIAKLGSRHVAALRKGNIETPSDYDGVAYISLDKDDWKKKLGQELEEAGFDIDWNKVMRQ